MAYDPPSQIGIISKPDEPRAIKLALQIAQWAADRQLSLYVNDRLRTPIPGALLASHQEIISQSQVIIVLGGDGTMIAAAGLIKGKGTPVLGINLGTLGYLTEFTVDELLPALDDLANGDYQIEPRMMLDWHVLRDDEMIAEDAALNEVVVAKATTSRIIDISTWVGAHQVTTYRADGLIVSTPTGSTAYNLSAGGPIISPVAEAIVLCPICPHTLTNRPLVLPHTAEITLQINARKQQVTLSSDGRLNVRLQNGDRIRIQRSSNTFNTICPKDRDYFEILRTKLRWSGR